MKKLISTIAIMLVAYAAGARTLIVYYSYTNNVERIVTDLRSQIDADVVEIEPAENGLDYAANNYAIGSSQIAAIRNNPTAASSYPAIDPVDVDLSLYNTVIVAAPLWWSQMAAPLQTFLFHNGAAMAGKNIGVIVSSASSGISGVVSDAKRLIPGGKFLEPNLWIRSSQTSSCHGMIATWLKDIDYESVSAGMADVFADVAGQKIELYSISGLKVAEADDLGSVAIPAGIYIARSSNMTKKIVVK